MNYFIMQEDSRINQSLKIIPFEENAGPQVQVISISESIRYTDFMAKPYYLFSESLKKLIEHYDNWIEWVAFAFVDGEKKKQLLYFIPKLPVVNCVSEDSIFTQSRKVKKLYLDEDKVKGNNIFIVKTEKEKFLIINLNIAEGILRRDFYGVKLERIGSQQNRSK